MPEPARSGPSLSIAALRAAAAAVVLATPGVARLEPGLRSALRRVADPASLVAAGGAHLSDGVHVARRSDVTELTAELVLDGSRPADEVAEAVRAALVALVVGQGEVVGRVRVHVLGLDP